MLALRLEFLGQVRITDGDEPILDLASDKLVALLAYLALTGESFARPQLEALLWGESPPENAQTSLRTAVYNLNKRLSTPLQSTRRTVWFAPERPFTLDVVQFRELIRQGDSDSLQTAVSLYRGDFLAGLTIDDAPEFELWLLQERERLRLDMLTALDKLMAQWLAAGRLDLAIPAARRLLEIEPWREATHRELMLLLARSGDYNAAIKQYQQCRAMLAAELDVPPMPETEALYQRILALRQRPPQPNLPTPPPLVGREPELNTIANLLADPACRLVVISGMGGIGKTSLALAVAARHNRHFLDGVFFVSLAELESAALLDTAVAEALGITFPPGVALRTYLCQQLKARELLLVLDNAEHLLTDVEGFIQELLAAAPELKIVLTSREKPRLRAASVLPLTGLLLPTGEETAVIPTAATDLFAQHARRVRPDFSLAQEWPHVVALCQLVQGSPLGIELAAAQLDRVDCAMLVTQLEATVAELAVDFQDMPPRHRSLRALFSHSWALLAEAEQGALAKLAVFRGGFTPEAAQQVADIKPVTLRTLAVQSLLQEENGRFTSHPLLRQFAQEQLPPETAVYAQHARYFSHHVQTFAESAFQSNPHTLLADLDNIRAMWTYAIAQQETTLLNEATHGLARFYAMTNLFSEGRLLFAQAVAALTETAVPQTAPLVWGQLLARYAMFLFRTGQLPEALRLAEESTQILRPTGDAEALAFSLNLWGTLQIQSGRFETAVTLLNECADLYRLAANPALLLKPLVNLSSVQMRLGNYETAVAHLNEALPLAKQVGDQRGLTHIHNNLGANYLILGDLAAAYQQFTACLPLTAETGYQSVRLVVYQNLAEVSYKQGNWTQAIAHCEASLEIAAEIGDEIQAIRTQKIYALALHATGEQTRAWQILRQAVQVGYEAEAMPALMDVLTGAAVLMVADGEETAVVEDLLRFIVAHPATEQQYVQEAQALLAQKSR